MAVRILRAIALSTGILAALPLAPLAEAASGELDRSFGDRGKVRTQLCSLNIGTPARRAPDGDGCRQAPPQGLPGPE
jgi:hypothetical protein